jgi:hypothetical protein
VLEAGLGSGGNDAPSDPKFEGFRDIGILDRVIGQLKVASAKNFREIDAGIASVQA